MKKLLLTVILMLLFPLSVYSQPDLEFISLKLFETGYNTVPRSERYYTTYFSKDDARYIGYEIYLKNNLYNIRDNNFNIKAKYYYPDGSLMGAPEMNKTMPYDWESGYFWHSWGWDDPGNWKVGTYTIEIYIDGRYITQQQFTIYDPNDSRQYNYRDNGYEFDGIKFLESGYNLPDYEDYRYATHFRKYDARYIYTEVDITNNLYNIRNQTHEMVFKYYNPDGSLRGRIDADYEIKSDWKTSWITRGWGWDEPGNWPVGTYKVEVYMDNRFLTEGMFTIY